MANTEKALEKLNELIQNARTGNIIPFRLTGQLEEIAALLAAQDDAPPTPTGDIAELLAAQAKFISVTVHELRTPMTSIRGYGDMLASGAMGPLNDMQKQFIETIRTNARRMEGLLQDVSDVGKIRAQALRLSPKMDMFKNIAMVLEKECAPLAEELHKSLTFDIPQGLPILDIDGDYLAKAIRKLVDNGLRYSHEDGAVHLSARGDGNWLVIEVRDNGFGMNPDELSHLGELYWRSENESVRMHKGSGMGIPIAFGIIDLLGGRVNVESAPNVGTVFTVRVPGMT
ncbi:MAG: sensor histidine kinase [Phototrophicaceae bacterium]|jgi:signal transduction histidine kinase